MSAMPMNKTIQLKAWLKSYRGQPLSLVLRLLMVLSVAVVILSMALLLAHILARGIPALIAHFPEIFSWNYTSENLSLTPALVNTVIMIGLSLALAVPVGVAAAIYLVEYAPKKSRVVKLVLLATETLSGIPSIIYGLFGYLLFVLALGFGYSLAAGVLTLAMMVLPLIIRTSQEALQSVPVSFREGSFGLGAGRLRTVFRIVLPSAASGIASGIVLAVGRIVGESAALIFTAGTYAAVPTSLSDSARTLSVHLYALLSEGLYTEEAYASAVVLLVLVVAVNTLSRRLLWKKSR